MDQGISAELIGQLNWGFALMTYKPKSPLFHHALSLSGTQAFAFSRFSSVNAEPSDLRLRPQSGPWLARRAQRRGSGEVGNPRDKVSRSGKPLCYLTLLLRECLAPLSRRAAPCARFGPPHLTWTISVEGCGGGSVYEGKPCARADARAQDNDSWFWLLAGGRRRAVCTLS